MEIKSQKHTKSTPGILTQAQSAYKLEITKFKKEALKAVSEAQGITLEEAEAFLSSEEAFQDLMDMKDKEIRMHLANVMYPKFIEAAEQKINKGSLEQAKHAMTAASIVKDKAMGADKYSSVLKRGNSSLSFKGKNLQVNLGFKFEPYKKQRKKLKG